MKKYAFLVCASGLLLLADSAMAEERTGKQLYEQACVMCHADGAYGAPRFGSVEDWQPRIAKGKDALYSSALNGHDIMPAKNEVKGVVSDTEIKRAVDYMVGKATPRN